MGATTRGHPGQSPTLDPRQHWSLSCSAQPFQQWKRQVPSILSLSPHAPRSFLLLLKEREDASLGFRLSIHPPGEVPDLTNTQLLLKPGRAYTITFSLQETMSEEGLEQLSEEQRRCTFPHEKKDGKVTLFNNYTQSGW